MGAAEAFREATEAVGALPARERPPSQQAYRYPASNAQAEEEAEVKVSHRAGGGHGSHKDGQDRPHWASGAGICRLALGCVESNFGRPTPSTRCYPHRHPDPFALHKTFQGCVLEHVGLADLVQAAEGIDQESVDADRKLAVPGAFADRVDDERSSRLYLALKRLVEAENLDAIAIRCWPELPRDYGQWPYLAVTRLADEGLPVAHLS